MRKQLIALGTLLAFASPAIASTPTPRTKKEAEIVATQTDRKSVV